MQLNLGTEFTNGCRAPTWRQMHGDITYIVCYVFDKNDPVTITCNRNGIYENDVRIFIIFYNFRFIFNIYKINIHILKKNLTTEKSTSFNKVGNEAYKDLISLLKEKSHFFKENIAKIV
jgi:hypothetical protein